MLLHLPHTLSSSCLVLVRSNRYGFIKAVFNCFLKEWRVAYVIFFSVPRIKELLVLLLWPLYHKFFQNQNISLLFLATTRCPDTHPAQLYVQRQPWAPSLRKVKLMMGTGVHCGCILCHAACKVYNHTQQKKPNNNSCFHCSACPNLPGQWVISPKGPRLCSLLSRARSFLPDLFLLLHLEPVSQTAPSNSAQPLLR